MAALSGSYTSRFTCAAHRPVAELAAVHEDAGAGRLPGKTVVLAP